jgi:hypothetical protein
MANNTRKKMMTAMFRDRVDAQAAHERLLDLGYASAEINVLMSDATRAKYFPKGQDEAPLQAGSAALPGAGVGGAIGTAVGATLAAVMAIGTSVVVPGLGLALAGPLAAAFAGAGAGAVTGGIVGALVGWGIPEPNARAYHEALQNGGVILGVVPHDDEDEGHIRALFKELHGENVCAC